MENTNNKPYPQLLTETNAPPYEEMQYNNNNATAPLPPLTQASVVHNINIPAMGGGVPLFPNPSVGPESTTLNCPQCRCRIQTQVRHRSTAKTHIACLLLSWTFCCCCLPYCMDSCRNANHFCPMCGAFIGTYQS